MICKHYGSCNSSTHAKVLYSIFYQKKNNGFFTLVSVFTLNPIGDQAYSLTGKPQANSHQIIQHLLDGFMSVIEHT